MNQIRNDIERLNELYTINVERLSDLPTNIIGLENMDNCMIIFLENDFSDYLELRETALNVDVNNKLVYITFQPHNFYNSRIVLNIDLSWFSSFSNIGYIAKVVNVFKIIDDFMSTFKAEYEMDAYLNDDTNTLPDFIFNINTVNEYDLTKLILDLDVSFETGNPFSTEMSISMSLIGMKTKNFDNIEEFRYNETFTGIIDDIITDLPKKLDEMKAKLR